MINWIKEWSQEVIVAVIIATILEMLLPNNKNKKYITSIIGIYILFTIIFPVVSKVTGKDLKLENYLDQKNIQNTNYTIENFALLENDTNIEDLYIKTLKQDITNKVTLKGYTVDYINISVDTTSQNNYGEIQEIKLNISLPRNNDISDIEEINIDISNENNTKKSNVSSGQINNIKEMLMEEYGISKNKIHINS